VPKLQTLNCMYNQIRYLDLTGLKELKILNCSMNQISELGGLIAPRLNRLHCNGNRLVSLDLSGVPKLQQLVCTENSLAEIDIRHLETRDPFYFSLPNSGWDEGDLATIQCDKGTRLIQRPDQDFE